MHNKNIFCHAEIQTEKKSTVIKTDIATKNSTKEIVKLDFMEKKSSIKNQSTHNHLFYLPKYTVRKEVLIYIHVR